MKKFLILAIAAILIFSYKTQAQVSHVMAFVAGDTIVNAGSVTKILQVTTGSNGIFFSVILNKISGTPGGKVYRYEGLDGTNYVIKDSVTIANAVAQALQFSVSNPVAQFQKIIATGTGTDSVKVHVYYRLPIFQTNNP